MKASKNQRKLCLNPLKLRWWTKLKNNWILRYRLYNRPRRKNPNHSEQKDKSWMLNFKCSDKPSIHLTRNMQIFNNKSKVQSKKLAITKMKTGF